MQIGNAQHENQLVIRPAAETDRAGMESIASRTWEGYDYLPMMITPWLADPEGEFYVATLPHPVSGEPNGQRVVGVGKLTRFGPTEWWLEGLRVDPDLYGKGIGRALQVYGVARFDALAASAPGSIVRLCTDVENAPVHRMMSMSGFELGGHFRRYNADAQPSATGMHAFHALTEADLPKVRAFLDASPHYQNVQCSVIGWRWVLQYITDERLKAWMAEGRVHGWTGRRHDPESLDGLVIGRVATWRSAPQPYSVEYLDALPGSLALLAQAVRGLVLRLGCSAVQHMLLARPERLVAMEQAGWRRPEDDSGKAVLYSRPVATDSAG